MTNPELQTIVQEQAKGFTAHMMTRLVSQLPTETRSAIMSSLGASASLAAIIELSFTAGFMACATMIEVKPDPAAIVTEALDQTPTDTMHHD